MQCTPVWKLIKKALPQFRNYISRATGSGRDINIWTYRIMGSEPRNLTQNLRPLQIWLEAKSLNSLYDISTWDQNSWQDWKRLSPPKNLRNLWTELKLSLSGSAPTNNLTEDRFVWDPNGGIYTVKEGYKILQNATVTNNWALHKVVGNQNVSRRSSFLTGLSSKAKSSQLKTSGKEAS